jgi:hypothetical protein
MARMEPIQILEKSLQGSRQDPVRVHNAMAKLVKTDPNFRVMRAGNTLFSYYNNGNGVADVAMDTADTPRELVKSIKEFVKAMKTAKFKQGRFSMSNPQIEKVLKMIGVQYQLMPTPSGQMMAVVNV